MKNIYILFICLFSLSLSQLNSQNTSDCMCSDEYDPVCAADGSTYPNFCFATCENADIVFEGACEGQVMSFTANVGGIFTYFQTLGANSIASDGPYWEVSETPEWAVSTICADWDENSITGTFAITIEGTPTLNDLGINVIVVNQINSWTGTISSSQEIIITVIENNECICIALYDPVCAEDGQTYANSCEAGCEDVDIVYEGECEEITPCLGDFDIIEQEYIVGFAEMMLHLQVQNTGNNISTSVASVILANTCASNDQFTFDTWASGDIVDMYFNYSCMSMMPYIEPFEAVLVLSGATNCIQDISFVFDPQGNNATGCNDSDGTFYNEGSSWNIDDCTFCSCFNGEILCAIADCAMPPCEDFVYIEGQCCPVCEEDVLGCLDPISYNYNPDATIDDGSCVTVEIWTCEVNGVFYPVDAIEESEDEFCICMDDLWDYGVTNWTCMDPNIYGCTNPQALNYNPEANTEDGSCELNPNLETCTYYGETLQLGETMTLNGELCKCQTLIITEWGYNDGAQMFCVQLTDTLGCSSDAGDFYPLGAFMDGECEICQCVDQVIIANNPYWVCEEIADCGDCSQIDCEPGFYCENGECLPLIDIMGCIADNGEMYPIGFVMEGECEICFCEPSLIAIYPTEFYWNCEEIADCNACSQIDCEPGFYCENGDCLPETVLMGCAADNGEAYPFGFVMEGECEICFCMPSIATSPLEGGQWFCEEITDCGEPTDCETLYMNMSAGNDYYESWSPGMTYSIIDANGTVIASGANVEESSIDTLCLPADCNYQVMMDGISPYGGCELALWTLSNDSGEDLASNISCDECWENYNMTYYVDFEIGCSIDCECPLDVWDPVCAENGEAYSYSCFAECLDLEYEMGECNENPDTTCICPMYYNPVCGSNGITYSNGCFAECEGIDFYEGECLPTSFCELLEVETEIIYTDNGSVQLNITIYNNSTNDINYPVFSLETANDYVSIEPLFENAYWLGAGESTTNSYSLSDGYNITGGGIMAALVEGTYYVSQLNQNAACAYPVSSTYEPIWGGIGCYANGIVYPMGSTLTSDCETCYCPEIGDATVIPTWECTDVEDCGEPINYILIMYDSWGDGWNGAEMTITNTNGDLAGIYTMEDANVEMVDLDLIDGCYNIEVSGTAYANSEISWAITENMYPAIYDGGAPFSGVLGINTDCGSNDPCDLIDCADGYECVNGDCINIEPQEYGCTEGDQWYEFGSVIDQECNTCTCMPGFNPNAEGFWMCTMMPCEEEYGCELDGELYEFGSSIEQGCNMCYCQAGFNPNGIWSCTEMAWGGCTDPEAGNFDVFAGWDDDSCEYEIDATPNWDSPNTGSNHTLVLADDMLVELEGTSIGSGDWIGVFYTLNDELVCGGYAVWNGGTTVIPVQGDDTTTEIQDGFNANQEFQWLVWDSSANTTYSMDAIYDQDMPNQELYSTNGISAILTLTVEPLISEQELQLVEGWNLFSTYMVAEIMDAEELLASFIEDIVIVKNYLGLAYLPDYNFNGIGDLLAGQGYQVKLNNSNNLIIEGDYLTPEDNPIDLVSGWNLVAYLRTEPADVIAVFEDIQELVIVKDNSGMAYLPEYDFNGIGNMMEGQGYQIKVLTAQQLQYLANSQFYRLEMTAVENNLQHYKTPLNTGSNMSLVIEENQLEGLLNFGDEVAVYSKSNRLVGAFVYQDQTIVIPVYGNDEYSKEQDGLLTNETLNLKYWSNEKGEEISLNTSWNSSTGLFEYNSIQVCSIENANSEFSKLDVKITPNPAILSTTLNFELTESSQIEIQVFNVLGDLIFNQGPVEYNKGENKVNLNIADYASGNFIVKLQTNSSVYTKRLLVQ